MALLLAWQFVSALLHAFADDTPIEAFFWRTHYSVGFTIFVLAIVRGLWGFVNLEHRLGHGTNLVGRAAKAGHLALYGLMIVVPTLAIMRAMGNGRGFAVYGIQVVERGGEPNPVLTTPASVAHGFLGWVLLALIVGHIAMALIHQFAWRDGTLDRMMRTG